MSKKAQGVFAQIVVMALVDLTPEEKMICLAMKNAVKKNRFGMNQSQLADLLGIDYERLKNLIGGRTKPKEPEIVAFRRELMLGERWPYESSAIPLPEGDRRSIFGTPLLPLMIAGRASAGPEHHNVDVELTPLYVPAGLAKISEVGFKIDNDSMEDLLHEDDACGFKRTKKPESGKIYLWHHPDTGYRIKLLAYKHKDWYMCSINPNYAPEKIKEGTQRLGMLVGYFREDEYGEDTKVRVHGLTITPEEFTQIFATIP